MTKTTERLLQAGIIAAMVTMIVCGLSVGLFTLNRMSNHDKLIRAQVDYQKRLTEQIGKPQEIRQIYESPQK